jgi:hypothetical protein
LSRTALMQRVSATNAAIGVTIERRQKVGIDFCIVRDIGVDHILGGVSIMSNQYFQVVNSRCLDILPIKELATGVIAISLCGNIECSWCATPPDNPSAALSPQSRVVHQSLAPTCA